MLTRRGRSLAAAAVVLYVAGVTLGYDELLILGTAAAVAVAMGFAWVAFMPDLDFERRVPMHVERGVRATADVVVSNKGRVRTSPVVLFDQAGGSVRIAVPKLAAGSAFHSRYRLPTGRRALVPIGPAVLTRSDPFGSWRVERRVGPSAWLWVRPNVHEVAPLSAGRARDVDGGDLRTITGGGSTFEALRDYVPGDDPRFVHWPSSARLGRTVVREFVDTTSPEITVVFDNRACVHTADGFEEAAEVVASLAAAAIDAGYPTRLVTACDRFPPGERAASLSRDDLLDGLAELTPAPATTLPPLVPGVVAPSSFDTVIAVTGHASPSDIVHLAALADGSDGAIVVVCPNADAMKLPSTVSLPVVRATVALEAVQRWDELAWA